MIQRIFTGIATAMFCLALCGEEPRLLDNGVLALDGWRGTLSAFDAKWRTLQPASAKEVFAPLERGESSIRYRLGLPGAAPGVLTLALNGDEFKGEAVFEKTSSIRFLCLQAALSISQYGGVMFEADGRLIRFPDEFQGETIISKPVKRFRFPSRTGEILMEGNFVAHIQDGRKWNGSSYGLRIGFVPHSGEVSRTEFSFTIRHGKSGEFGPELGSIVRPAYIAAPGTEWKAFEYHRNVLPDGALDFSKRLNAPAGKYGPLVATADGHFVFRDRPEVPVRFYGANFVGDSQLPDRKQAEELADRMAAFGFNAVRIHHHDNEIYDGKQPSRINPERMDRLEYLLGCFAKRGIYYTTDVYVSRRNIPAAELGAVGAIETPAEYKALFYVDETVFDDWKKWAEDFLGHVNPHTGFALKDDPALIFLSLVNEGNPATWWNTSPRTVALYRQQFETWAKGRTFEEFLSYLAVKRYEEMKAFLRGIGCNTLLTDQNFRNDVSLAVDRSHYDFTDNHAYWDHPRFAEKRWNLPVLPNQVNPLAAASGVPGGMFPTRLFGKGFTVTEFDYANPNIYRAVGPGFMAAYAAFQDWDGLFPFAYAHSLASVVNPDRTSGFFDISTDPVKAFSQRIGARLFLAGGIEPAKRVFATVVTEPFKKGAPTQYPDSFCDLGFLARIGTLTGPLTGPGKADALIDIGAGGSPIPDLIAAGKLPKGCYDAAEGRFTTDQLELNRKKRTLRVNAPGGELLALESGQLKGTRLEVENRGPFSVFALLPVDTERLGDARRLALMHLTNTQATGMKFGNDRLDRLESWGKTPFLAKHGAARITLRLSPGQWEVHALDTAGKRIGRLDTVSADGTLTFEIDNFRYPEAVFAYEVSR